jgi:hypothetical protein
VTVPAGRANEFVPVVKLSPQNAGRTRLWPALDPVIVDTPGQLVETRPYDASQA